MDMTARRYDWRYCGVWEKVYVMGIDYVIHILAEGPERIYNVLEDAQNARDYCIIPA